MLSTSVTRAHFHFMERLRNAWPLRGATRRQAWLSGGNSRARPEDPPTSHRTGLRFRRERKCSLRRHDPKSGSPLGRDQYGDYEKRAKARRTRRYCEGTQPNQVRALETGWWRRQSGANRSPLPIPCYQGNLQGISPNQVFSAEFEPELGPTFRHLGGNSLRELTQLAQLGAGFSYFRGFCIA
jgi:hypothetical protein